MLDGGGHLDVGGRRARARVYASCSLALCGGLAGCVLGAQGALAVAFFSVLFSAMLAAVGFSVREWWRGRSGGEGATEAAGAAGEATPLLQSSAESNVKAPPRQASRLWHLDDVKVSLTSIVVMHHVGCAFAEGGFYVTVGNYETSLSKFSRATAALDQSYFMALFFFLAGIFTPGALCRGGTWRYLQRRCMRLLVPTYLYLYAIGPVTGVICCAIVRKKYSYQALDVGPLWFAAWLVCFSMAYAAAQAAAQRASRIAAGSAGASSGGGEVAVAVTETAMAPADGSAAPPLVAHPPSLWALVRVTVLCVVCTVGIEIGYVPSAGGGSFLGMPMTIGALPYDIAAFWLGCAVGRHKEDGWLEAFESYGRQPAVWLCGLVAFGVVVAEGVAAPPLYARQSWYWGILEMMMTGVWALCFSLAVLALSRRWMGHRPPGTWRKAAAQAAFGVYVFHPPIVMLLLWAYVRVLERFGDVILKFDPSTYRSSTPVGSEWRLWAGWAAICVASQVVLWPMAWAIRTYVPGAKCVL